jgi:hypothetical protein
LARPSDAEEGVSSPRGVSRQKNFDTQRIPNLQPLVDKYGATAVARLQTKSTKSRESAISTLSARLTSGRRGQRERPDA